MDARKKGGVDVVTLFPSARGISLFLQAKQRSYIVKIKWGGGKQMKRFPKEICNKKERGGVWGGERERAKSETHIE